MSEHISTLEGNVITSLATGGEYHIAVHDKENAPTHFFFMGSDQSYSYSKYCEVLKGLWENYINKGEKPKLLGLTLTDEGLVAETIHCIAPAQFSSPDNLHHLPDYRESFAYWLKTQEPKIKEKLDSDSFSYLNVNLESILRIHLTRKQKSGTTC